VHFYQIKFRVTFCSLPRQSAPSISGAYPNATWLEREVGEMFGLPLTGQSDGRNLLLDYASTAAPMRRVAPSMGYEEVFYSPVDGGVVSRSLASAEL